MKDLPVNTKLKPNSAKEGFVDTDVTIKFFFLQRGVGDDQYMCTILNNENGKGIAFLVAHLEIKGFVENTRSLVVRSEKLEYIRRFADQHIPHRPFEVVDSKYVLGEWVFPQPS